MIIGENFLWLHFPKCAGTFTEKVLRKLVGCDDSIHFDPIDPNNVIWHQDVAQRERILNIDLSSKDIICNFRRLPYWIISRIIFEQLRSNKNVAKELYTCGRFYEQNGNESNADAYFRKYTKRNVHHWIRTEYFEVDFIRIFSNYITIQPFDNRLNFDEKINASEWGYKISDWYNDEDLKRLYKSCPLWAQMELKLYGNLLIDENND